MRTLAEGERICPACEKNFYMGMTIDTWVYKIGKMYYCKYSCYKPAAALVVQGKGKTKKIKVYEK